MENSKNASEFDDNQQQQRSFSPQRRDVAAARTGWRSGWPLDRSFPFTSVSEQSVTGPSKSRFVTRVFGSDSLKTKRPQSGSADPGSMLKPDGVPFAQSSPLVFTQALPSRLPAMPSVRTPEIPNEPRCA